MILLATSGMTRMTANATKLTTAIDDNDTTLVFDHSVFTDGQGITIGGEPITLGTTADGGTTFTGCTRGGSPTAHADGQEAWLTAGVDLVDHEFDGIENFNAFSAYADIDWVVGITEDGTLIERIGLNFPNLAFFRPFHRYVPANLKTFGLVAWLRADNAAECEICGGIQA